MKRYKYSLVIFLVCGLNVLGVTQQPFVVKGKINDKSLEGATIRLNYNDGGYKLDTCRIVNGAFEIRGMVSQPVAALLYITAGKEHLEFFIDKEVITVKGRSLLSATVAGGADQEKFERLSRILKKYKDHSNEYTQKKYKAMRDKDSLALARANELIAREAALIDSMEKVFIAKNPASHLSLRLLEGKVYPKSLATEKETLEKLYGSLHADLKNTSVGVAIKKKFDVANKFSPGKPAIDFTLNDTLGRPVSLSSFRGRYVLLDFWASWCLPCRAETPHLVKAYERFKDKNFTILAVSFDIDKFQKAWRQAIRSDNMTWPQVCDPSGGSGYIAQAYGISSIPMNYLLDPNGIIIATSLRGEEVAKKLEEIFSANELH